MSHRDVRDFYGRTYRVGEMPHQIMGRSRAWMLWLPWVAMMAAGVFQYGYGAMAQTIAQAHGWSLVQAFWVLAIWAVFQGGVAYPVARLRDRSALSARTAMLAGALACLAGMLTIAHTAVLALVVLGYSVLGGIGCGLVYATSLSIVGKWYPERRGPLVGFVTGGFAYGAVPFIFLFGYTGDAHNYAALLDVAGIVIFAVIAGCGVLYRDPPKNWWPPHIDPQTWALDRTSNRSLAKNPTAVRQYAPLEALRSGMLPLMYVILILVSGVSLFCVAYQVAFAHESGFGPFVAATSMGVLAVVNGAGRPFVGWVSDRLGRRGTLTVVLLVLGLAQLGLLVAGEQHNAPLFLAFAFLAGLGGGAFHPLFAGLVPDYFGEANNGVNFGVVYSAKLVSGLAGIGLAASVITATGYRGAYLVAGSLAIVGAALTRLLHQPGRPRVAHTLPESKSFETAYGR
ncbi:MAG: OFA family MFS transporter [Carbonactinosporaceae bacterium]